MPDLREHANELLQLIQSALPMEEGAPKLEWNENDQCSLTFDEDLAVVITLDEVVEAMFLNWVLGELPTEPAEALDAMQDLLEANYEWRMTEGGTLGIDPDTSVISLCYRVDLPLDDPAVVQTVITKLYNISAHWQRTLNLGYATDAAGAPAKSVRDLL
jgi:hypothetical protein